MPPIFFPANSPGLPVQQPFDEIAGGSDFFRSPLIAPIYLSNTSGTIGGQAGYDSTVNFPDNVASINGLYTVGHYLGQFDQITFKVRVFLPPLLGNLGNTVHQFGLTTTGNPCTVNIPCATFRFSSTGTGCTGAINATTWNVLVTGDGLATQTINTGGAAFTLGTWNTATITYVKSPKELQFRVNNTEVLNVTNATLIPETSLVIWCMNSTGNVANPGNLVQYDFVGIEAFPSMLRDL